MAENNLAKGKQGYGYKYTDLAQIHEYLEERNITYYQYVDTVDGNDYIMTVLTIDGKDQPARRGCKIPTSGLGGGKTNAAQELGAAITYARRYSLLMVLGLATEDDDAACMTKKKMSNDELQQAIKTIATSSPSKRTMYTMFAEQMGMKDKKLCEWSDEDLQKMYDKLK